MIPRNLIQSITSKIMTKNLKNPFFSKAGFELQVSPAFDFHSGKLLPAVQIPHKGEGWTTSGKHHISSVQYDPVSIFRIFLNFYFSYPIHWPFLTAEMCTMWCWNDEKNINKKLLNHNIH